MSTTCDLPPNRFLLTRLQREWDLLARRPAVVQRARRWDLGVEFDDLVDLVAATGLRPQRRLAPQVEGRRVDVADAAANDVLARVVVVARTDTLAARVVLQRMLPGLSALARRHSAGRFEGHLDAFDELLSAAWAVIREFPVERRPRHVVANLLRDTDYHAFTKATRRLLVHEPTEPQALDLPAAAEADREPLDELAEVVRTARQRLLTADDLHLLRLLVRGCTAVEVAAVLQVSVRTVGNRRGALVDRLRDAALAA